MTETVIQSSSTISKELGSGSKDNQINNKCHSHWFIVRKNRLC